MLSKGVILMKRSELKEKAKKSLRGKYGQSILALVIFALLTGIPAGIASINSDNQDTTMAIIRIVAAIVGILLASLLGPGLVSFFIKVSRNRKVDFKELFAKANLWVTWLFSTILMNIFVWLWTLLLIIPGIIAAYRYRLTPYIIVDNPKVGALEAITKSKEMMKGHKFDLFVLDLSFIGWTILAVFTFGLLYFWLAPYMNTTYSNFYNSLKATK